MMRDVERDRREIEQLLARINQGERDKEIYDRLAVLTYQPLLKKVLFRLRSEHRLGRTYEAHDVAHRVMERLRQVLESRPIETVEHLVGVSNRNVTWTIQELARKREREASGLEGVDREDEDQEVERQTGELEDWGLFHEAALRLGGREGEVFWLRYYERWPEARIAGHLGVSTRTVRNDWRKALDALAVELTGKPLQGQAPRRLGDGGRNEEGP